MEEAVERCLRISNKTIITYFLESVKSMPLLFDGTSSVSYLSEYKHISTVSANNVREERTGKARAGEGE